MVSEQLIKIKGSTDPCSEFHFLFVRMPQFIKRKDEKWMIGLFRRKTTRKKMEKIKSYKKNSAKRDTRPLKGRDLTHKCS